MRSIRRLALIVACALVAGSARPSDAQVLTGLVGAVSGAASGGYITLSLVVARAQAGHYMHEFDELFGWTSFPVLIGAATGGSVGVLQPDRLWSGFVYGVGGAAAGTGIGLVLGSVLTERPEGKWAGAAIGAGAGLALGNLYGLFWPRKNLLPDGVRNTSVVPIGVTIRF